MGGFRDLHLPAGLGLIQQSRVLQSWSGRGNVEVQPLVTPLLVFNEGVHEEACLAHLPAGVHDDRGRMRKRYDRGDRSDCCADYGGYRGADDDGRADHNRRTNDHHDRGHGRDSGRPRTRFRCCSCLRARPRTQSPVARFWPQRSNDATGLVFEVAVPTSYAATIEAMCASPENTIGFIPAQAYVLANQSCGVQVALKSVRFGI